MGLVKDGSGLLVHSVTSRCILVLFEWYGHPKKCAPKISCNPFSIYIFHVKTKWNIVYKYLKTKIFSRDTNILPQMHWTSNIFGHSATIIGVFLVSLNYPILNFKKKVCPKNVWMGHSFLRLSCILRRNAWIELIIWMLTMM